MAHNPSVRGSITDSHPIVFSIVVAAVIIAAMLVLTAVFGFNASGPSLEIVPDPAGIALPF